mgnify:FL=1
MISGITRLVDIWRQWRLLEVGTEAGCCDIVTTQLAVFAYCVPQTEIRRVGSAATHLG